MLADNLAYIQPVDRLVYLANRMIRSDPVKNIFREGSGLLAGSALNRKFDLFVISTFKIQS